MVATVQDLRRRARMALITRAGRRTTDVNPNARSVSVEMAGWWSDQIGVPVPPGTPTAHLPRPSNAKAIEEIKSLPPEQRAGYLKLRAAGGTHARVMRDLRGLPARKSTGAAKAPAKKAAPRVDSAGRPTSGAADGTYQDDEGNWWLVEGGQPRQVSAREAMSARQPTKAAKAPTKATPARKGTGSLAEGVQQAQEAETRRELADRETARQETARQIEQRRTPATKAPAKKSTGSVRDALREQGERDARRESADREARDRGLRDSLGQSHTQEAGEERRPAAKATPAKKATTAEATPAKATPPAKAATPRKAAPAASVEDHVAALDRLGTREEAQQYLANVRGQALRDLARRYSAHGGIGGGSAQGMRDGIVDATVGARLDSAAILQGATLPYGPRPSDAAPREATPAKATPPRVSAAERRAEAELRELRAEQQMSSTPSRLNGRIMAAEQKLEDARAARATKAAAPRAPRKAAPSAEERLREKLLPPDEERRLRDERDRLSSRIRANRTAVSNGSEEAIASTERDRREQARISRRLKAHYDARDALQRQERETASATPRAATPAPTFNPNDRALLALADADSLEGDIGDPVLPPEVVNALINTSGPRPITPQGGLFSGSRRYELTPEGRERVAELLASMPSSDSPAGRAHESGLSAAAAKWRELSISDASELESARTRRDRVAILRNIMQTLARRPGTSREDREQAAALWARENAWLQTEGNRPVALDPALLADAAGLTGPDRESYIRWARGNPGDTITVSRWRVLRQMGMLNDEGAAPSEAGSTPVTDLSDYRRALDNGLSPRDAASFAAWARNNPGGSIAEWQAQRR